VLLKDALWRLLWPSRSTPSSPRTGQRYICLARLGTLTHRELADVKQTVDKLILERRAEGNWETA